jgi:hypothetical protein
LAVRPELSILSLSGRLGSPNDGEPSMSITKDAREDRSGSRRVGLVTAGGLAGVAAFEMALAPAKLDEVDELVRVGGLDIVVAGLVTTPGDVADSFEVGS